MDTKPKATKNKAKDVETPKLNYQGVLQFLDSAASQAALNRQGHVQVQAAVKQLGQALVELEQFKKEKADGKNT
jgi:hypothetical protein